MRRVSLFSLALLALIAGRLHSAEPKLEVSPRSITVGDPFSLTLTIPVPDDGNVFFPVPEQFAPAEVLGIDTIDASGRNRTLRYSLSLFEPGVTDLPDLPVVISAGSANDTIWIDPGTVEVTSVIADADTSALRDIRPPVKIPWTFKEMLPYIIGALVVIALVWWLNRWWKKRKGLIDEVVEYVPPPIPPDVKAMRRLEELRVKKLWQDGKIKEFHSELTDILKEYIGESHGFNAPEMTSEELFSAKEKWSNDEELFSNMKRILTLADFVKFARLKPLPHDHEKSLELAFAYVTATRPRREPLPGEAR